MSLTAGRAFTGLSCLQLGVMAFLQLNCVCVIISTFVVRCLNIKGTTPVLFPERRTCLFITKSKVSINIILALLYRLNRHVHAENLKMIEFYSHFGMRHVFLYSINTNKNENTYQIHYLHTGRRHFVP